MRFSHDYETIAGLFYTDTADPLNIPITDHFPISNLLPATLPAREGERLQWGKLYGNSPALAISSVAREFDGVVVVTVPDLLEAARLENEIRFFLGDQTSILTFPDWETLPYDLFSPLPELVSQRLLTLYRLQRLTKGIVITAVSTLMQRLCPVAYLEANSLIINKGQQLALDETRRHLEQAGYSNVSQVMSHGEFTVRGSLLDIFPMGNSLPFRIDLFDDEVETIRTFDPETQRTREQIERIHMLPAREFPLDETGISHFRQAYRTCFEGDPQTSLIYKEVSEGNAPAGIEYYLPLFFDETATLFDYLPEQCLHFEFEATREQSRQFFQQTEERYEQRRHDQERPPLTPAAIYLTADELASQFNAKRSLQIQKHEIESRQKGYASFHNFHTRQPPHLVFQARSTHPAEALQRFISNHPGRILFVAESAGRREMLLNTLRDFGIQPMVVDSWNDFLTCKTQLTLTIGPLEQGLWLEQPGIVLITETQLYGERVRQERRRKAATRDADQIIRNLTELHEGAPVVHEDHGVGRYLGLQILEAGGIQTEFLTLEYAKGDKLFVPVSSLHLISRYTGVSPENAPLHRLGGEQWERIKRKAAAKARDVAAELLEIHARRAAHKGFAFPEPDEEYAAFAADFEFEETPDQLQAINSVLADMAARQPMDRVVCGDVGFGKTEVAMRAAFMAVQGGKQVAVLVPTTLLAQQHYQNFADRFADWPVKIESLSRFRTSKQQKEVIQGLAEGRVDIIVGTHKLLQSDIRFKNLGLVIIDEEHRFGVRHKEKLKAMRAEVDMLTLTATPIPRTLNMAMSGMRDLSIIATPPTARHPIKTFINQWSDNLISEACLREIKRGGQVYFLHNEVSTIENTAAKLERLLPGTRIQVAHGQMRERELESIMRDFYHQRFNILVCTTIIESGIDVPSANTIIINRADKLGLAQLHQLRGRVGRSHHRAYAYLITPSAKVITPDAKKRLEAIESMEDLGAGFTLATHDLEIRGAGELLGDDQSGQIQEIGFTMYRDLLERAVTALKSGQEPILDRPLDHGTEVDLSIAALLPEDYLPDVHSRLVLYKRIANTPSHEELRDLQVEMIDRFGLLPEAAKNLFAITELKLVAQPLGITKIEAGSHSGRLLFDSNPDIDPARLIHLIQTRPKEFKLDGSDKLRFFCNMEDSAQRAQRVTDIINMLRLD